MKYRLNKAETKSVTIYNVAKTKKINGHDIISYSNFIKLVPGEEYTTDDDAMIEFFKSHKRKVRYTSELASVLDRNGVPYEIELCKSCGGKIRKISYQVVEVYDE